MKRSRMLSKLEIMLDAYLDYDPSLGFNKPLAKRILDLVEVEGMLPPLSKVKLVPDSRDGCMKHSEVKREWDDE